MNSKDLFYIFQEKTYNIVFRAVIWEVTDHEKVPIEHEEQDSNQQDYYTVGTM